MFIGIGIYLHYGLFGIDWDFVCMCVWMAHGWWTNNQTLPSKMRSLIVQYTQFWVMFDFGWNGDQWTGSLSWRKYKQGNGNHNILFKLASMVGSIFSSSIVQTGNKKKPMTSKSISNLYTNELDFLKSFFKHFLLPPLVNRTAQFTWS